MNHKDGPLSLWKNVWLSLLASIAKIKPGTLQKNYEKLETNKPAATVKVQHPVPVNAMRLSLGKVVINFVSA